MISAKIDYLTISLLPDQSGWTISEALDRLFDCLLLKSGGLGLSWSAPAMAMNSFTSKWWLEFLQNAKKANLTIHKVKRNKFYIRNIQSWCISFPF